MTPEAEAPGRITLGDNNLWALRLHASEGGGVLLIDAGIDHDLSAEDDDVPASTWDAVVAQADALGFAPPDVRAVLVTHEHIDHAALAARWAAEGARIVCGRAAMPALALGRDANEAQREARSAELRRHGVPATVLDGIRAMRGVRSLRWAPCPPEALVAAEERSTFRLADGRTLRAIPAPGHTPGNLVALIEESRELLSGDTVLATTIPTPGLHFPGAIERDPHAPRWPSLPPFLRSVAAIRALGVARVYPGHGDAIDDPAPTLDRFETHHARRGAKVRTALRAAGAATAFEVARTLFPRLPDARLGQAMTEVLGHLDLAEEQGVARRVSPSDEGGVVRWEMVAG
ncbi:MAG: MBL fold metallo-hydrolase [Dehalococcoidia bacterium]